MGNDSIPILVAITAGLIGVLAQQYLRRTNRKREFACRLARLKSHFPNDCFIVVRYPPFVVVTDEEHAEIMMRLESTIPWAIEKLRNVYSWKEPRSTIELWLFTGRSHYDICTKMFYDEKSRWSAGRFMQQNNAVVADISVGNGVLVHETVHAFIHADFPCCPAWFNEGLASLYNRCDERDGEMHGHPDGAIVLLQSAILSGRTLPIERLCALTYKEFHAICEPRNYAQSHYLCYYLQERGLLKEYYRAFYANRHDDPTGCQTLKRLAGATDMQQLQRELEAFVLAIAAP